MTKKEALARGYCRDGKKIFCCHWYPVRGVPGCQHGRLPSLHQKGLDPRECPLSDRVLKTLKIWKDEKWPE